MLHQQQNSASASPLGFGRRDQGHAAAPRRPVNAGSSERSLISTFTIGATMILILLGVVGTGTYMFLRDDLVSATLARHARMQHAYEDRLAAMRAQVDIVTSRQLLDQQAIESRVERLMARQHSLSQRERHLDAAMDRASKLRAIDGTAKKKPQKSSSALPLLSNPTGVKLGSLIGTTSPFAPTTNVPAAAQQVQIASASSSAATFEDVESSLAETEKSQIRELAQAAKKAERKARKLAKVLKKQGIKVPFATGTGGPLIELKSGDKFLDTINALDASLKQLGSIRSIARALPHGSPVPGQKISSRYGARSDPFTKRRAVHGGLDFRARTGVRVLATASGKVVKAGRHGGYGKLVEIKHSNGLTTRYAHLSRISVKIGQRIGRGKVVGKVGSTGRSTGPHLHYEVRKNGQTVNPLRFVRLGRALKPYL